MENARTLAATLAEHGASIVSGGTDNHLMLVDVRPLGVNGKEADAALGEVRITVNKNTIPYDPEKPMIGSGVRVGTPAVTSRGMREAEMREIGALIVDGIAARGDESAQDEIRRRVAIHHRPLPGSGPAGEPRGGEHSGLSDPDDPGGQFPLEVDATPGFASRNRLGYTPAVRPP